MNRKNILLKKIGIPLIITTVVGPFVMERFLDGKIIEIPRGTLKGAIIVIVGYIIILFTVVVVTLGIQLLIKKKSKKTD